MIFHGQSEMIKSFCLFLKIFYLLLTSLVIILMIMESITSHHEYDRLEVAEIVSYKISKYFKSGSIINVEINGMPPRKMVVEKLRSLNLEARQFTDFHNYHYSNNNYKKCNKNHCSSIDAKTIVSIYPGIHVVNAISGACIYQYIFKKIYSHYIIIDSYGVCI